MPDDAPQAAHRFGSDLRSRREEHGLSLDDLGREAGVPRGVLEDFESGALPEQAMFNRVYLRSLARTYAASAGFPSGAALVSLEAALGGTYEKNQLQHDIEEHEREAEQREAEQREAEQREAEQREAEQREAEQREAEQREAEQREAEQHEQEAAAETKGERESGEERERGSAGAAAAAGGAAASEAESETEEGAAWSAQSPPGASEEARRETEERQRRRGEQSAERDEERREGGRRRRDRSSRRRDRRSRSSGSSAASWIVGVLVVLALAVGAYFLFRSSGGPDSGEPQAAAAADTAAAQQQDQNQSQQQQGQPANLQLGQTVDFTVVAQGGPVREIRITRDEDVRRPYWIEEGQAKVFPAGQRIVLEREAQLDKIRLLVNGYPYPTDRRDAQGRIVITRQDLQTFADTLRGEPVLLSSTPDTAAIGGAP